MEFNNMPDDCIFTLLKPNFPLKKLVRLRGVSKTWKKVVEKICLSKTELNLFDGLLDMVKAYKDADPYGLLKKADLKQLAPNLLTLSKTTEAAEFIASLFPNVTKLVCGLENCYQVALLMHHWSKSLEDVTIIGKIHNDKNVRHFFWNALNLMPNLKRLHFYDPTETGGIRYKFIPYAYFVPPFVAVFNQLEYFAITARVDQVFDIFGYKKPKHGQAVEVMPLRRQNRAMAANLTHLVLIDEVGYVNGILNDLSLINAVLALTEALRHLDVSSLGIKLISLMSGLQHKNNLESIRLKSTQLIPGNDTIVVNPLNSVKRLHLIHNVEDIWQPIDKPFNHMMLFFPSLEHLEIVAMDAKLKGEIEAIIPRSVVLTFSK